MSKEIKYNPNNSRLGYALLKYPKIELIEIMELYNAYIIEVVDREDGSIPVCLNEWLDNEYQELLEER